MQVQPKSLASNLPAGSPQQPPMYQHAQPNGMAHTPQYSRSFDHINGLPHPAMEKPTIYTAVYSGVSVYEMEVNRIAVMRRRADNWLNATQILKVAGVDKGKRTKVLEKEILTGEHEKVQGGYGKYQGTWINYRRGREFCRQYGVEDMLRPLLDYDLGGGDGNTNQSIETPTKEQAMAANRKRFYTQSMDGRMPTQNMGGTFFSNISATATSALAAMNKVARMNSPAPRPASTSQRGSFARPSQGPSGSQGRGSQHMASQDSFRASSQQSVPSLASERSFGANGQAERLTDSAYGTAQDTDMQEPPRKRMKASQEGSFSHSQPNGFDMSMREGSPTEPSESFYQTGQRMMTADGEVPTALPPLPWPREKDDREKQEMLMDLFLDQTKTDYTNDSAILQLSGPDLDIPIDASCNTALHWAATLARVPLMRLLVAKGANMFRGNSAGQTPLMSAVSVNNSLDHSCFPETLEILAPLIELRDLQGRTILHHIAVVCAIKGRAASSKYYLEALLEYLVRSNIGNITNDSFHASAQYGKPIGLMRFMQEIVNARDKTGNTALNLAARIGNRNIISQLMEVKADPTIPNDKGTSPMDFGVGTEEHVGHPAQSSASPSKGKAPLSKVDEKSREIIPLMSTILQNANMQFTQEARLKQDAIDRTNEQIADLSARQKTEQQRLDHLRARSRIRQDRAKRIANLKRWLEVQRRNLALTAGTDGREKCALGTADAEGAGVLVRAEDLPEMLRPAIDLLKSSNKRKSSDGPVYTSTPLPIDLPITQALHSSLANLPAVSVLRHRLEAYVQNNKTLADRSKSLKEKDGQLENMYRKVVSLCTKVSEERVDAVLDVLMQALESDPLDGVEVGRVREFLRKVEGVEG